MIDEAARKTVHPELMAGEKILWTGRPQKSFDAYMLIGVVIVALLLGFVYPDAILTILDGLKRPSYGTVFLTLIVLLACFFVIRAILLPGFEFFALTDRRVIILRKLFPQQMASIPLNKLKQVKVKRQGRLGRVYLFMTKTGLFPKPGFEGSIGMKLPFFKMEGFILQHLAEPEAFLQQLQKLHNETSVIKQKEYPHE